MARFILKSVTALDARILVDSEKAVVSFIVKRLGRGKVGFTVDLQEIGHFLKRKEGVRICMGKP